MFACFEQNYSNDYAVKQQLLNDLGIALWDVLQFCVREGSSDNSINQEYPNDFNWFFNNHREIKTIIFNGDKARVYFERYVKNIPIVGMYVLPSTSPANTWKTKSEKVQIWEA